MAIKRGSKVSPSFSAASMTDMIFLLLTFLLIATTILVPSNNALKLTLPTSSNEVKETPYAVVSITADLKFYLGTEQVAFAQLETALIDALAGKEEPTISLYCDKSVPIDEVVKVMNIAKRNNFRLILATNPE